MTIRLATAQDKSEVLRLFDEFSDFLHSSSASAEDSGQIFDEVISGDDTSIFVAEDGQKLVGLVTLYELPNIRHGWHRGHIEDVFVSESVRGKGVATQLFAQVKKYCQDHQIKVVKLDSGNELAAAHKFYEKEGGKTTERFFRFDL